MPRGNYSHLGDIEGNRQFAIREPAEPWSQGQRQTENRVSESADEPNRIEAKEPDRQNATRRGSRGRAAMESGYEEQEETRGRSAQRGSRRGTQARRATERTQTARRSAAESRTGRTKKSRRGFAAMSPEQQREIARKGGLTVSRNRRHMADIGRIGGEHSHGGRRARR